MQSRSQYVPCKWSGAVGLFHDTTWRIIMADDELYLPLPFLFSFHGAGAAIRCHDYTISF